MKSFHRQRQRRAVAAAAERRRSELGQCTVAHLRAIAQALDVPKYKDRRKAELADVIASWPYKLPSIDGEGV